MQTGTRLLAVIDRRRFVLGHQNRIPEKTETRPYLQEKRTKEVV